MLCYLYYLEMDLFFAYSTIFFFFLQKIEVMCFSRYLKWPHIRTSMMSILIVFIVSWSIMETKVEIKADKEWNLICETRSLTQKSIS